MIKADTGVAYVAYCGRTVHLHVVVSDKDAVTCSNCLKRLEKTNGKS